METPSFCCSASTVAGTTKFFPTCTRSLSPKKPRSEGLDTKPASIWETLKKFQDLSHPPGAQRILPRPPGARTSEVLEDQAGHDVSVLLLPLCP